MNVKIGTELRPPFLKIFVLNFRYCVFAVQRKVKVIPHTAQCDVCLIACISQYSQFNVSSIRKKSFIPRTLSVRKVMFGKSHSM